MPDEVDVPLEDAQDKISELHEQRHGSHSEGDKGNETRPGWTRYVAVATALLAVIAAVGALQSGLLVNEALLQKNEQIGKLTQASDQWNYYQAEGLKSLIYKTTAQGLPASSPVARDDAAQAKRYQEKQDQIKEDAERLVGQSEKADKASDLYLERHHIFAFSVSLCQIAIALSAIAALTQRRRVWLFGLAAGVVGAVLLIVGFLR
jgi:hypothetical protein